MNTMKKIIPGLFLSFIISALATLFEQLLPIHIIGRAILALFIGMSLHPLVYKQTYFHKGLTFTSKKVLKFAIILMGSSLSMSVILNVGKLSLNVMVFTLLTCFSGGYFIGKLFGIDWRMSSLISAGTGICGGSAIAALSPVIKARDADVSYAMSTTFLFDMLMILLFPLLGQWLGLSDIAYGLWTGTAVNDTSSVVAAGYAFSEQAGNFATTVKLTRTLAIIPTILVFSLIQHRMAPAEQRPKFKLTSIFPWFILGFVVMAFFNTIGIIPTALQAFLTATSKFLMVMALGAIGLKTSLKDVKQSGVKPFMLGFIISALVVIVALIVEIMMGLITF